MRVIAALRRRLRQQDGIILIYALVATVLVLAAATAAFAAISNDTPLTATSSAQKQAYSAAQAGLQRYLYDLDQNSEFWTLCTDGKDWLYNPGDPATPQLVPGSSTESYAVTLLPANGYSACSTSDAVDSMIATSGPSAGMLRISSTGYAGGQHRTIVASFREQSFLDYVYFTMYETSDPLLQVDMAYKQSGNSDFTRDKTIEPPDQCDGASNCGTKYDDALNGAENQCGNKYSYQGRYDAYFYGRYACDQIQFINDDEINGPFHTNDTVCVSGSPQFGRPGSGDAVEFGRLPGWPSPWQNCGGTPKVSSKPTASILDIPQVNDLSQSVSSEYDWQGTTCLTLEPDDILVGHTDADHPSCEVNPPPTTSMAYPANGVVYASQSTSGGCPGYDVDAPVYDSTTNFGCGTIYVHSAVGAVGGYGRSLTIGTAQDIVIDGNLEATSGSGALLGLVATNFVRVYHPVGNQPSGTNKNGCSASTSNATGALRNPVIDAMILSLDHSFVVDQYDCGGPLGTLTVSGGIAQKYRGTVGTGSQFNSTGYVKDYVYDDHFQYEEPPHFLTPVEGGWTIERQTECDAASCDASP